MSSGELTLIWRGKEIGPSSVVGRLPLKPPDCTPAPQLLRTAPRLDVERYPPIGRDGGRVEFGLAVGSSVEIDLGDLEGEEASELLLAEAVVDDRELIDWRADHDDELASEYDELEALLAASREYPHQLTSLPRRNWLRRVLACGVFIAAFWLAHVQLGPWLD